MTGSNPTTTTTKPSEIKNEFLAQIGKIFHIESEGLLIFVLVLIGATVLGILICCCCICVWIGNARKEAKKKKRPKSKGLFKDQIPGFQTGNETEFVGELEYTLEYDIKKKMLKVSVVEARDLITDSDRQCNPFCRLVVTTKEGENKPCDTKVVKNTTDPAWSQTFSFKIAEVKTTSLYFEVFDRDSLGNDIKIGKSSVDLFKKDLISFLDKTSEESTMLEKCPTEYMGLGDVCIVLRQSPEENKLFVTLLEAKKLRLPGLNNKDLPEVWMSIKLFDGKKRIQAHHSSVKKHTRDPYFNETLEFQTKNSLLVHKSLFCSMKYRNSLKIKYTLGSIEFNGDSDLISTQKQWSEMLKSPRKPIAMWHTLQKIKKKEK